MDEIKAVSESNIEAVQELVRLIGAKNTLKIIKSFSGSLIYLPTMDSLMKNERNIALYDEFMSGASYKQLALKYGLSDSTIRNLINKTRAQNRKKQK